MLFQPLFKAPAVPPFDNPYVSFSNSYVDFLLLRFVTDSHGRVVAELTIIDAKAMGQVKIGAMVQVAYYALLLETLIASDSRLANVRDHLRVARHGGVWLYGEAAPTPFLLREVRHKVDAFLRDADGLRSFLTEQRKEEGYESQEWRLAPTCRNCGFLADCRAEALPPAGASGGATASVQELCCTELQQGLVSSLQENHRMCDQLAWFARDVLGYAAYQACHLCDCPCSKRWHACGVARGVPSLMLDVDVDDIDGRTAAEAFRSTSAFVMIEVQASSAASDAAALDEAERALIAEAKLVADIVQTYLDGASTTWGFSAAGGRLDDSVFVVTPHHVQRVAILREIEARGISLRRVQVATVEKMQGQERDLVVACYAGLDLDEPSELGFAYSRERLNVAVSRAKKKCVLLCSPAVLHPPMAVIETAEMRAGLELLRRIAEVCGDSSCVYATRLVHDYTTATAMDVDAQGGQGTQGTHSQSSELSPQSRRSYSQSGSQQLASQASQPSQQGGQSCGAGSQVAIDDDETEDEGEDEGAPPPLVVPILPPGEMTPTGEDMDLARTSLDSAATAELREVSAELRDAALYLSVPLEARSRLRPWALVPDVDWPELVELPARMRGWARRGVAVRPVPPGRVEELESYTPALHAVAVDLHKVVAAQIRDGVLRGGG